MDDNAILDLYFARSEQAILETDRKYGSYAVMQDGSRVEIMNSEFVEPIDLEKLDYILLADGTKLPAPGN